MPIRGHLTSSRHLCSPLQHLSSSRNRPGPRPQRTEHPHRYPRSHEVGMTDSPRRDGSEPTQSFGSGYPVDYPDPAYSNQPPYQGSYPAVPRKRCRRPAPRCPIPPNSCRPTPPLRIRPPRNRPAAAADPLRRRVRRPRRSPTIANPGCGSGSWPRWRSWWSWASWSHW